MARRLPTQLFVSRLSFYTTNEELKRLFSPFGVVTEARLVKDPRTQRPKGFGFVTYESEVEAQSALKAMDGRLTEGCSWWKLRRLKGKKRKVPPKYKYI
ncbi:uncharacterized protein LOC130774364 isoform X1 [Actinidia eriantha]|nr:uncharacterized protein LOC130774364 isoform X1 [Actinidia eriantha]